MFGFGLSLPKQNALFGGAPFVGALDAWEAYIDFLWCPSHRLLTSYAGAAGVVAKSTDGTTADAVYSGNGELDLTQLASDMGGATPLIRYVYCQAGSGNRMGQATTLSQPTLGTSVSQWGNKPAMVFAGFPQVLQLDSAISPTGLIMGVHSTSSSGLGRYCAASSGDSSMFELGVTGAYGRWDNADGQVNANYADSSLAHQLEMWYNGGSSIIRIDTAEQASAATAPLANVQFIGDYTSGGGQAITGSIAYMIGLNAFLGTSDRAALRAALAAIFPFAT